MNKTAPILLFAAFALSPLYADTLQVKVLLNVAKVDETNPSVTSIYAEHDGVSRELRTARSNPWVYSATKREIRASLGQEIELHPNVSRGGRLILEKDKLSIDSSSRPILIIGRLYDDPTYYQMLVYEAVKALDPRGLSDGSMRASNLLSFFSKMDEAASIVGTKDANFRARYTQGLCELVGKGQKETPAMERLEDWFQWACREQKETDPAAARTQLAKLTDKVAAAEDPAWRKWFLDRVLSEAYIDGVPPLYGSDSLREAFLYDGDYEGVVKLALMEFESNEALSPPKLRAWCDGITTAFRKTSGPERQSAMNRFRQLLSDYRANDERTRAYLRTVLIELDAIPTNA